jgi:hypothetical protein
MDQFVTLNMATFRNIPTGDFFKFAVEIGIEESIVNALHIRITDR